jgi:hypothetical protein
MVRNLNHNIGPISALKGYRLQFLYSLFRILSHKEQESIFLPEGQYEDLDIYDNSGNIIEIIQVKAHSVKLTLSDILSSKDNSFIRRSIKAHFNGNLPKIKLVSFGAVNEDLLQLSNNNYTPNFIKKLENNNLNENEIKILQNYFKLEIVDENQIMQSVIECIKNLGLYSDYNITLDLFIYWIYIIAETQKSINTELIKEQYLKIGKFQSERTHFYKLFGSLIRPLIDNIEKENLSNLKSDFYQGISANYKHILAGVDVIRSEKLSIVKSKFLESNIVFIHGASGQGKSTLAYRYLFEYCNTNTVFELKLPSNLTTIFEIINSLEGISKGVGFPITLYIDVIPGNNEWINVLNELATNKEFNFLITIREEDWNTINVSDKFQFSEMELSLQKEEAQSIYFSLNQFNKDLKFIDFEEAWENFGGEGPLLEFVFLITQKESLPGKLKSQINRMQDDLSPLSKAKLKLLRYVTVADCFNARVKYKEISIHLDLDNISHLIDLLQNEYLIKTSEDKTYLTGLHPVRSTIIKDLLFDKDIFPESDYVLNSLKFIADDSILNFLRNAFLKGNLNIDKLLTNLKNYELNSWQAYYLIFNSLLWKGIYDYINSNIDLLNKVYKDYHKGWPIVINFDFTDIIASGSLMEKNEIFGKDQQTYAKEINDRFTNKNNVLKYCNDWILTIQKIDVLPDSSVEWNSFGNFLFWLHYFDISNIKIKFEDVDFLKAFRKEPIQILATILYCIKQYKPLIKYLTKVEPIFLERILNEFNIILIEEENESINCHYLFDIIDEKIETEETDKVHAKSIKIIELMRYAFPDKEFYNTNGFGHKFSFLPNEHDSSIKKVPKKNLPLKPLVEINSTFINLFNYSKRTNSWQEYINEIIKQRQFFIKILKELVLAFNKYHKEKNIQPLVTYILNYINNYESNKNENLYPLLPKIVIDEWGEFSEGQKIDKKSDTYPLIFSAISVKKYQSFLTVYSNYSLSIDNFIKQSANSIAYKINEKLKKELVEIQDDSRVSLANLFKAYESLNTFQNLFNSHFEKFIDSKLLQQINSDEINCIESLCYVFRQFIYENSFIQGTASNIGINYLRDSKLFIQTKISSALKRWRDKSGPKLIIKFLEEKKQCLIFTDVKTPLESLESVENIYGILYNEINQPEYLSIKYLIINTYYPTFCVIPLILGKTINNKMYEFKFYNLIDKKFRDLASFNLTPREISQEFIDEYNIQSWNRYLKEFEKLNEMLESISILPVLAFHFIQLRELENKAVNESGEKVLQNQVRKVGILFQENFQKSIDLFSFYLDRHNNNIYNFDENEKIEFSQLLLKNYDYFFPNKELNKNGKFNITLSTKEMSAWLPNLEELRNNILVIYYVLAGKVIRNTTISKEKN